MHAVALVNSVTVQGTSLRRHRAADIEIAWFVRSGVCHALQASWPYGRRDSHRDSTGVGFHFGSYFES